MSRTVNRAGEIGSSLPMRSDRFFAAQGEWFFSTREGAPIGPFGDKEDARKGLDDFIEFMSLAEPKTLSRLYAALTD
ncbi:DUF6316 family protein [Oceanicoccus sagamiensis]|uniref:DUF6316 domain-containing protein n=1 Tax=Oceanicoccus sagamiensis TaxID=716816 RepID=A0A1X9N7E2_9GAMM|nr:DUF6316 family protein [Oceanicoccus sagamiensis]ARN73606.1 hypothetical protein BST96_05410 [Oceanicoccus sagamiensis]